MSDGTAWRCVPRDTNVSDDSQPTGYGLSAEEINGQLLRGVIEYAKSSGASKVNQSFLISDYGSVYAWGMRESDCGFVGAGIARCQVYVWIQRYLRGTDFRLYEHREVYRYEAFATYAGVEGSTVYARYNDNYASVQFGGPIQIVCSNGVQGYPAC